MYIALDGDFVGRKIETLILSENLEELKAYNTFVTKRILDIERFIIGNKGVIYLSGGDNILAFDPDFEQTIGFLTKLNENGNGLIFSVGIGAEVKLAYLALKYAKRAEKSKIVKLTITNDKIKIENYPK
jgi:GTP cyclohydrolase III